MAIYDGEMERPNLPDMAHIRFRTEQAELNARLAEARLRLALAKAELTKLRELKR